METYIAPDVRGLDEHVANTVTPLGVWKPGPGRSLRAESAVANTVTPLGVWKQHRCPRRAAPPGCKHGHAIGRMETLGSSRPGHPSSCWLQTRSRHWAYGNVAKVPVALPVDEHCCKHGHAIGRMETGARRRAVRKRQDPLQTPRVVRPLCTSVLLRSLARAWCTFGERPGRSLPPVCRGGDLDPRAAVNCQRHDGGMLAEPFHLAWPGGTGLARESICHY